tara:strand:+ start:307 stop:510 length:204 start_codon:yes stop_codon:yes gene_type:complete
LTPAVAGGGGDDTGFAAGFMLLQANEIRPIKTTASGKFINRLRNCIFINEVWFSMGKASSTTIAPKI